jgi:HD-GYP domain-containing protein (c-di-GMP phosphodiesterase class II)
LDRKTKSYLIAVNLIGLTLTFYAFGKIEKNLIFAIILWTIIAIPLEIKPIQVSTALQFTLSFPIHLSLLIIYGHWLAIIVAALMTAITDIIGKRGPVKLFFNLSQFAVTLFLTGTVFSWLKKSNAIFVLPDDLPAFICASGVYILVNLFLVSFIVALVSKRNVLYILQRDYRMVLLYFTALAPISMLMVLLYKEQPLAMALIIPPLALAHTSFRNYISLRMETRKTLEILADFVDRRDHYTAQHSRRVSEYAMAIADEMGIDDAGKELIELAGRVHDLGKIAISDSILLKPGRLTHDEMNVMHSHPDVAYSILRPLNMYKVGAGIVKSHHERYDGFGYPQGLKNKDIHIGASIMAVADSFDAMTSDRPYRKAMSANHALAELEKNAGKQFHPEVVEAFKRVMKKRGLLNGG